MTILGLDPGLATTGYALVRQRAGSHPLEAVEWGIIQTPRHRSLPERLATLAADLTKLLAAHHPQRAVVELLYFAKNSKTAMEVAQARGTLLLVLQQHGIPILECTPRQLKLSTTAHGGAPKRQVQTMVTKLLNLRALPRPDDAADALALAVWGSGRRS